MTAAEQLVMELPTAPAPSLDLADLLPNGIGFAFGAMDAAEDALEAAAKRHPGASFDGAFLVLRPRSDVFAGRHPRLLGAHHRELLARIARNGARADVGRGTAAEVVVALASLSAKAPLRHEYYVAYTVAFLDAFGAEQLAALVDDETLRRAQLDRSNPRVADVLDEIARQAGDPDRQADWKAAHV